MGEGEDGLGVEEEDEDDPNLGPSEPDACYFELIDPATGVTYVASAAPRATPLSPATRVGGCCERGWCAHASRRYYVFSETGESSWFPPKWIDVYDDNTGYYYYTNTKVRRSTSLSPVAPWLYTVPEHLHGPRRFLTLSSAELAAGVTRRALFFIVCMLWP
jgi:hypothetical protein